MSFSASVAAASAAGAARAAALSAGAGARPAGGAGGRPRPLVLVAEDDADIRDLMVRKLRSSGLDVLAVADGVAALAAVRDHRPDLVLLDVMMPGLTGIEVCSRLRADDATSRLPVVLVTARARDLDARLGYSVGADEYVVKPFSPARLVSCVQAVLVAAG